MEFWGIEVLPGQTIKVEPGENKYLHLSQASLGEVKKDKGIENVPIFVKINAKKLVLGTLSSEKCAQIQYDLVFEKEFELSHGSKSTSIHFFGYKTFSLEEGYNDLSDGSDSFSESDEDIKLVQNANGRPEVKAKPATGKENSSKPDTSSTKPKPKVEDPKKEKSKVDESDDDESDDDESEEDLSDDDEDMHEGENDSDDDDEDDESSDEDEATPKKLDTGSGSKRPSGSALKTPVPEKKAKLISPGGNQKTGADSKKGGHIATPHPAKQGKTPANSEKSKQQTPKSGGSFSCKSCTKSFNSDNALQAHSKAKHGAAK